MRARHKFRAKPANFAGQHFASRLELAYYNKLEMERKVGAVLFFLRQVPFHLPGGVKYVVDYQIFYADGTIRFVDIKGMETAEFIAKKKIVEALYPIEIEIVKRNHF